MRFKIVFDKVQCHIMLMLTLIKLKKNGKLSFTQYKMR